MSEVQLSLSPGERELLSRLLQSALGEKRVEVRRTEFSSTLHDELRAEEQQLRGLLDKLEKLTGAGSASA